MKQLQILCRLVRGDLMERVRRTSFLLVLGITTGAGYFLVPPWMLAT